MQKNVKLILTNGEEYEYTEAGVSLMEGGVLAIKEPKGDCVTYYAPGAWHALSHNDPAPPKPSRRVTKVR